MIGTGSENNELLCQPSVCQMKVGFDKLSIAHIRYTLYQYSNMTPRLSGQMSIFGGDFFVSKSLLGIERQKKLKILQFGPESFGAMLEY